MDLSYSNSKIIITGMHRSGTTMTGRLISNYNNLHVIHEPFNRDYGVSEIDEVYPCDYNLAQREKYLQIFSKIFSGKPSLVRAVEGDGWFKHLGRRIIGGRTGIDLLGYKMRNIVQPSLRPVLKDPFLLLMSQSLLENGNQVISIVRHPAAIWLSIRRMGWTFSFSSFACPEIFEKFRIPKDIDRLSEIEKFSWLWLALYAYLDALPNKNNYFSFKHEDLCLDPYLMIEQIEAFLMLKKCSKVRNFVRVNMFSDTVEASGKKLHVFERNSKKLATSWYGRLQKDEESIIQNICGPLVESYYGKWMPY